MFNIAREEGKVRLDYNFRALGPQAFEQLVQALLVANYPSVRVFGRGRDGGRDAVIEGFETALHDGSRLKRVKAVVQVKWVDASDREPAIGWKSFRNSALSEIKTWQRVPRAELPPKTVVPDAPTSQWRRAPATNQSPWHGNNEAAIGSWHDESDYEAAKPLKHIRTRAEETYEHLIFVTNASLSAVPDQGGLDKFYAEVPPLLANTMFEGVEVWHYGDLCALVDGNADIKNSYFSGLQSGDVREWLSQNESKQQRRASSALHTHLLAELRADQKMDAGHLGDLEVQRYDLSQVFVDLPAQSFATAAETQWNSLTNHLVSEFNANSKPSVLGKSGKRFVLVGGPGQGKTTVSRFIGQLFRASVVPEQTANGLDESTNAICKQIASCARKSKINAPVLRRWPFRVVLAEYASNFKLRDRSRAASGWEGPPLLQYLQREINESAQVPISPEALLDFMSRWPVLVVLDGMDETPSGLRSLLAESIRQFEDACREADVDLAMLITTRPQAVGTDFDSSRYTHLAVRTLPAKRAKAYGKKLLWLKFGNEPKVRDSHLRRLEKAIAHPDTKALFSTPLQVAILTTLLESQRRLPESRFKLFDRYFQSVYAREMDKPTALGVALERYQDLILSIHKRAALYLHLRSEDGRGASHLSKDEFEVVVRSLLAKDGNAITLNKRVTKIMTAIRDRLVFLIADDDGNWSFEIQSIREYMCALAFLDEDIAWNDDDDQKDRSIKALLTATANSTYWRNVWLLAAGASFLRSERARDRVMSVVNSLNYRDVLIQRAQPAAYLAVDLIADGVARRHPNHVKQLLALAIDSRGALSREKYDVLAVSIASLQDDRELAPTILTLMRAVDPDGSGGQMLRLICRVLQRSRGALSGAAGELLTAMREVPPEPKWMAPLETIAISVVAAKQLANFSDSESSAFQELQRMLGEDTMLGHARVSTSISDSAVVSKLAILLNAPDFVEGYASILSRIYSGARKETPTIPRLLYRSESIIERAPQVWPLVSDYVILPRET